MIRRQSQGDQPTAEKVVISGDVIKDQILIVRGQRVMLDRDLAVLNQITTGNPNKAVSRNMDRFPEDFMFQLSLQEFENLKFRIGTSSWGGTRKLPRAFTEQGVAMLSSVIRSKRAVQANVEIMRAFVKLRELLATHAVLSKKLAALERKYDTHLKVVFDAIRQLMVQPEQKRRKIGFESQTSEVSQSPR